MSESTKKTRAREAPAMIPATLVKVWGDRGLLRLPWAPQAIVNYEADKREFTLTLEVHGVPRQGQFRIRYLKLKRGTRPELVCRCCSKPRRFLLATEDNVVCRDVYLSRRFPGSVEAKRRLLRAANEEAREGLKSVPRTEVQSVRRSNPRPRIPLGDLGTERALKEGRSAVSGDMYTSVRHLNPIEARSAADNAWITDLLPSSPAVLTGRPVLEVQPLTDALLRRGKLEGWILNWPLELTGGDIVTVVIDERDRRSRPTAIIEFCSPDDKWRWQKVPILPRRGVKERWCFLCPIALKPVEALYFRNGWFGSRIAQKLYHPSQRKQIA